MFSLILQEQRNEFDATATGMAQVPPIEVFRLNFEKLDPETITKVVTLLMSQPKGRKRRKDAGQPKQPALPGT